MNTIIIEKRQNDYMASLETNPNIWGNGKTVAEAIGDLIYTRQAVFGILIQHGDD